MSPSRGIGDLGDKLSKIYQGYSNRGHGNSDHVRHGRGRNKNEEVQQPSTPSDSTGATPVTTQPVSNTEPISTTPTTTTPTTPATDTTKSKVDSDLFSLAGRYVDNYQKQAGKTLSSDQRTALVQDVYSFYSDPTRAGRLETLVNAEG